MKPFLLALVLVAMPVFADRDQEREDLISLMREIELLQSVIERLSARHADGDGHVVFRYDVLRGRVDEIEQAIASHIDVMDHTPRFDRFED